MGTRPNFVANPPSSTNRHASDTTNVPVLLVFLFHHDLVSIPSSSVSSESSGFADTAGMPPPLTHRAPMWRSLQQIRAPHEASEPKTLSIGRDLRPLTCLT